MKKSDEELEKKPPTRKLDSRGLSNMNRGGDIPKTVIISSIVTIIVLALVTFAGGMGFVTKNDFTANMVGVTDILDQAKVDLATAKSEVVIAVQGIPSIVTNQIGSAVTQVTSQWSKEISLLSDSMTTLGKQSQVNVSAISELTANIESANLEIVGLQDKVTVLESVVAEYEERIEELEGRLTGSGTLAEEVTTIWTLSSYTNVTSIGVDVTSYPYRIEEEGDYGITLALFNNTAATINNVIATVSFTPRRNDRIIVDDRDIYLYSYGSSIRWNVDVEVRSDGTCRRITFTSERFDLLSTDLSLEMDFTLEY